MKKIFENVTDVFMQSIQYGMAVASTNEILKTIELCCAIACSLIILIPKIVRWFKKSFDDGKLSKEEIEEGIEIVREIKNVKEEITKKEK